MEKKSSKKIGIIIGIVILLLLIAGGIAWYIVVNMDQNTPEEVFNAYIDCLKNQDYEGMYLLLSESTKARVDKETYLARNKNIYEGIEATNIVVTNVVSNVDKKNSSYTVTYTMTFDTLAGELSYPFTMTFDRQEDNKYYINWYSSLIFLDF